MFRGFFRDLRWGPAFRRSLWFTALWVVLVYVLSRVFPKSFSLHGAGQILILAVYAVLFFLLYAVLFAFSERRRREQTRKRNKKDRKEGEEGTNGSLKGRFNPNTSRRKARRRR
ncbi:MAG: hypothetical protein K6T51_02825 [Rubrobacteraceae bacterium]|uniref:hypothetical protein n=1 Tax=Rubrobacter naiadicus TaxID=1392641 RepID=UPI0023628980|nr:hypothetical protein [Rubrobacter naiadicus]MBX6762358.1 hypothetical protein [Rubrobacteraceae bacterium]MCL6437519.1 hypothetical protein [Rubrobacteraceae bacterium]